MKTKSSEKIEIDLQLFIPFVTLLLDDCSILSLCMHINLIVNLASYFSSSLFNAAFGFSPVF